MNHATDLGFLEIHSDIPRDKIGKHLNIFHEDLITNDIHFTKLHIDRTELAPFSYRERQLHSVFAPAMAKVADAFLMKFPVERSKHIKKSKDKFLELVKNTYRVLLSRGMKGCYVHFVDKDTERFFRSRME